MGVPSNHLKLDHLSHLSIEIYGFGVPPFYMDLYLHACPELPNTAFYM